jgi:hypothetical protein
MVRKYAMRIAHVGGKAGERLDAEMRRGRIEAECFELSDEQ